MRYNNNTILKTKNGNRYYKQKFYPVIPYSDDDDYAITTHGDRLDIIAYRYYNDVSLWWIISKANDNISNDSLVLPTGIQIRIPTNINKILINFNKINN